MTIMFVDDQKDFLLLLETKLANEKYQKIFCDKGEEAWLILNQEPVDVLVSDINMPGIGGFELLSRCKQQFPEIVRVAFSSMNTTGLILDAFNSELVHRYLAKPWRADDKGRGQIREILALSRRMGENIKRSDLTQALTKIRADCVVVDLQDRQAAPYPLNNHYGLTKNHAQ